MNEVCDFITLNLTLFFLLQRTVMEAVTALLDDGISIGLLVQGKKIRDDDKTLSQTGLSCRDNLGNLGFTLEPPPDKLGVPLCFENHVMSNPTDSTKLSERSVTYNFSFLSFFATSFL